MPPKRIELGPAEMCGARKCGSTNSSETRKVGYKVYKETGCKCKAGPGGTCTRCQALEAKYMMGQEGTWHGLMGGPIPSKSHIKGSEWHMAQLAKAAAKAAGASAAAVPAPEVKAAAKEAERAAKEAAAMQKRIATQAAAYEREQASIMAGIGRMLNLEQKSAAAAEKAAAKAAAAAARITKKATSARKPAVAAARRTSSVRRSSAKRAPATIYVPASAAAAAGSDETLGSLALSSDNSSNLRYYAAHPELGAAPLLPAGIPGPRSSSNRRPSNMMPGALRGPRTTSSNRRSTQRHVSSASSGRRSTARRSSSSHHSAAAAPAPRSSSSNHSATPGAAQVVQTNGAGTMLNLDALLAEMGEGGANLY